MASFLPYPRFRAVDDDGQPLAGGKAYFFEAGTTTPKAVYADRAGTAPLANPVTLNALGEAAVYLGAGAYAVRLTDAAGVQQWVMDIDGSNLDEITAAQQAASDAQDSAGRALASIAAVVSGAGLLTDPDAAEQLLDAIKLLRRPPVGTVEIRHDDLDPGMLYGGTWAPLGQGRVLVGLDPSDASFDTIGETGGAKTHTLTVDEMPPHTHTVGPFSGVGGDLISEPYEGNYGASGTSGSTGSNQPHNNLQPYLVVRFWRRTA